MNVKFLIVEDDEFSSKFISDYMKYKNYSFDLAVDAKSAVDFLDKNSYDLVLTDKNMPGLDISSDEGGMDVLRYVHDKTPNTQIVMMTGYATIETAIEALKLGAFDYIIKPFTIDQLQKVLDRVLVYRAFINPENTISIYKKLHNEILDLVQNVSYDNEERHKILQSMNEKMDIFFKSQKNWEDIVIKQREALTNISQYTEQILEKIDKDNPAFEMLNKINEESTKRL